MGFEPMEPVKVHWFSRPAFSTTQASLYYSIIHIKKPLAVSIDQVDRLGGDIGYMGVYRGNAFAPIKPPTFPTSRKTKEQI
jgi:hypothetical protein